MNEHCNACGASLKPYDFRGPSKEYCRYCTDDQGKLKPRDEVQKGIATWLKTWQGNITDEKALERAGHYMKAMPAWAE